MIGAPTGVDPTNTTACMASIRPRMAGVAVSCTRLFEPDMTSIVDTPIGIVSSAATATPGALARAKHDAARASAPTARKREVISGRQATNSDPATEPLLITESSSVAVPAPEARERVANSGSVTEGKGEGEG